MAVEAVEGRAASGGTLFFVKICAAFYVAALVVSFAAFDRKAAFSVGLGGAVALLNLRFLSVFLKAALTGQASSAQLRVAVALSFYARLAALAVALYLLAGAGMINFPALTAGVSVVPLAALVFLVMTGFGTLKDGYERAY